MQAASSPSMWMRGDSSVVLMGVVLLESTETKTYQLFGCSTYTAPNNYLLTIVKVILVEVHAVHQASEGFWLKGSQVGVAQLTAKNRIINVQYDKVLIYSFICMFSPVCFVVCNCYAFNEFLCETDDLVFLF